MYIETKRRASLLVRVADGLARFRRRTAARGQVLTERHARRQKNQSHMALRKTTQKTGESVAAS